MSRAPISSHPPAASPARTASAADISPGSDVSPTTVVPGKAVGDAVATTPKSNVGYFTSAVTTAAQTSTPGTSIASTSVEGRRSDGLTDASGETASSSPVTVATSSPALTTGTPVPDRRPSSILDLASEGSGTASRKPSTASVTFLPTRHPSLPQGQPKPGRILSPAPKRFRKHVGFDNIPIGEATKSNTLGYTLSISHYGYQPRRRSRTMMVGIDQNIYSDFALQWLLDEYADDGDEIICVHVVDKDARTVEEKNYKARADKMVERIKSKIPESCAISIKLEYAVGKLHATFQKLIQVYEPSMLVVGTRGRSLGGFQGLVNKNSFSKYCLQYSPVPTVVVRDYEKRKKKKDKRSNDPARHSYANMLATSNGVHEANSENSSVYNMEAKISADEEAHKVAAAIGLPAAFDPTLKPIDIDQYLGRRSRNTSPARPEVESTTSDKSTIPGSVETPAASVDSEDDDSADDDDEAEFEVTSGQQALQEAAAKESEKEQRKKLHEMEMGEAHALKHVIESDEED
ncbi:hypothetical protein HMPREF1624_02467 [Sporothrix schenckii ATCC 58251]|uniref:UspA domain-containing protein n=1 Tax=Sporothrix schenckii (strain ATCC 58251 / de Perez 2211183) TaxID=1391915 RepID=U7Q2I0_SPOS1|nr:hypothetical protein HMPREF1624_02467 [Sporothrix schenckii ATCC 58251]